MTQGYECVLKFKSDKSGELSYNIVTNCNLEDFTPEELDEILDKRCSEFADMVCAHFGINRQNDIGDSE